MFVNTNIHSNPSNFYFISKLINFQLNSSIITNLKKIQIFQKKIFFSHFSRFLKGRSPLLLKFFCNLCIMCKFEISII